MIHDVIPPAYPFPYTAKFMFVGVRNKTEQSKSVVERYIEYVHSVATYKK